MEGESATAQRLRAALHGEVRWQSPPSPHPQVDQDFDVKHYAPLVRQALVAAQALQQEFLSARDLASSIVPTLVFSSDGAKKSVVDKVVLAARQIAADKPGQYEIFGAGGANSQPSVEVLATPETSDPRGRTQQYQALARTFSSRGRRVPDRNQLDLYRCVVAGLPAPGNAYSLASQPATTCAPPADVLTCEVCAATCSTTPRLSQSLEASPSRTTRC